MTFLLGERLIAKFLRRLEQNDRMPRAWGFSIGWVFFGVLTFPKATDSTQGEVK